MTTTRSLNQIIKRYKDSLLDGDLKSALSCVNLALANGSDVKTVYKKIFTSAQRDIGQMWHDGEISISHENRAAGITLEIMSRLRSNFEIEDSDAPLAIVTIPKNDNHTIGARMFADFLMMEGWRVDYLTNHNINEYQIPNDDFIRYINEIKPKLFAISVATDLAFIECNNLTGFFKENFPNIKVIWGGPGVSRSLNIDHDIDFNSKENIIKFSKIYDLTSKPDFICCSKAAFESKECKDFLSRSMNLKQSSTFDETLINIGHNIKTLRISKGISQQELANLASIDRAFISTIENGKRNLSISVLHKIAQSLDSNITEIFNN